MSLLLGRVVGGLGWGEGEGAYVRSAGYYGAEGAKYKTIALTFVGCLTL